MAAPVGEHDQPPVAFGMRRVAVGSVRAAQLLPPELDLVVALLADPELANHADPEVVTGVAVRGGQVRWTVELLGCGRTVVEHAHVRTGLGVAESEQQRLPRPLAEWRSGERQIDLVPCDVAADEAEHHALSCARSSGLVDRHEVSHPSASTGQVGAVPAAARWAGVALALTISPVTVLLRSDARNSAAPATSSGAGSRASISFSTSGGSWRI